VGVGGVGAWAVEALARSGVGQLTLIDLDHVAPSNINRHIWALESTLGQPKANVARARILDINPGVHVEALETFVAEENMEDYKNNQI
jgi:tRNA A37 threonylcarbamoyladenosine dehydratase